jgi:phospholipid N-methyltransferase
LKKRGGVSSVEAKPESALVFARNFFKNPRMIGSVIPSSRFLINQLLRHVAWDEARVIVELGPGVGTISREILRRMRPDATLVAFEVNDEFVGHLRQTIIDPRFHLQHRSGIEIVDALRELQLGHADYTIAGIPFSIMSAEDRMAVLRNSREALAAGGEMLVYQFSAKVRIDLRKLYGKVERIFEPRNVPPAHVFRCVKQ